MHRLRNKCSWTWCVVMEKINGYDFASRVMHCPQGGIDALLRYSGNDESCWLELKAGMALRPEDQKKGEKPEDLYWNIAKAVIEIANTSGGILLIGIEDKTHAAVALEDNDPRNVIEKNGLEAYRRREILERIWPEKKEWHSQGHKWHIEENVPADLVSVLGWKYQEKDIAVVLIKPARNCIHIWRDDVEEKILSRYPGEVGKKQETIGSKRMSEFESNREIASEFFAMLYQNFLASAKAKESAAIVNKKIADYYEWLEEEIRTRQHFEFSQFTSLDASGNIETFEEDFMSPEASEIEVAEDDDWLNEDSGTCSEGNEQSKPQRTQRIHSEHRSGDLISLMQKIPRLIVLGEPGGGKTTTLNKFTTLFKESGVLAVSIPMGQWQKGGSLAVLIGKRTRLNVNDWANLIQEKRLRLVIDAVNECPDQFRRAALLDIKSFLLQNREIPAVISARSSADLADLKDLKLPVFSVHKMDENHQLGYLTRYLGDNAKAQEIFDKLKSFSGGKELATNPMLLRLVIEVFKKHKELPSGRAGLYHKWLEQWYNREFAKKKRSGEQLQWTFEQTLEVLSDLALQSRLQGFRDVPIDVAEKILQQYGQECLVKLCQGPVVTIDGEFIKFRHETFQEYLCAEKLIRQPDVLMLDSGKAKANATRWGMPLAYAAELCWPLPEPLWRAAWAVDPWMGVAVSDKERTTALINNNYHGPMPEYFGKTLDFSKNGSDTLTALMGQAIYHFFWHLTDSLLLKPLWYKPEQYLAYLLAVNKEIEYNWAILELWQLIRCNFLTTLLNVMDRALTLGIKNDPSCKSQPLSQRIKISTVFADREIPPELPYESFLTRDVLKSTTSLFDALKAVNLGLCYKEDFADKIPQWIEDANYTEARIMISDGFASKEDFSDNILHWIEDATPSSADELIHAGLASKEDFADKIPQWIEDATCDDAYHMINAGLASKNDFVEKIPKWIENATQLSAATLVNAGLASKEDFAEKIPQWIESAGMLGALAMIRAGLAYSEDFVDRFGIMLQ